MSELAHAMRLVSSNLPLCLIQFPTGRWGFVGSVPIELKWRTNAPDLIDVALKHGEGLARAIAKREGKIFATCTWQRKEDAITAATSIGRTVKI